MITQMLFQPPNVRTRDSYSNTRGELNISMMMGIMPMITVKDDSDMDTAGLLRWLTEIALYPTAFLPQQGSRIEWSRTTTATTTTATTTNKKEKNSENDDNKDHDDNIATSTVGGGGMSGPWPKNEGSYARATFIDRNDENGNEVEASVEFCFDENDLIKYVRCNRALMHENKALWVPKTAPWEGRMSDYEMKDGIIVPTRMECGWWMNGKFEKYFDARNVEFEYTFFDM